jgi:small Trp-rich protein
MAGKGIRMQHILHIAALVALRFLDIWQFAELSWGWIIALMVVAYVWFEFIEKMLGLDKKKAHDTDEKRRKARVAQSFNKKK